MVGSKEGRTSFFEKKEAKKLYKFRLVLGYTAYAMVLFFKKEHLT